MSTALRVVDEHQIKRYFKMDELAQLYEFNPSDMDVRETPIVPKDRLLAELLQRQKNWIVKYHEHESLLENQTSEGLSEEERKAAWEDYENEKKGFMVQNYRNSVMPVTGAPTILNHPGLPSLSLSSFSLEGVVNTIKVQNPNLSPMELCESVLLATKQIQKVHLNHYQRVQAMVYNHSCIMQADRLLNTPAPLVDKTRTTHSPVQNNNSVSSSSSSLAQRATKKPCNVA
ncbi:Transcriptional regulator ATRX [Portunus trituberculatus]|uniref:Transcriptional regulator ATRX n=1 Tax=Portunus trituberculatus TaxID=210409 RepID=A0A5B7DZ28_PORTR|nr:Transcriptional regulator ATRX [Portunus trituberculatus]